MKGVFLAATQQFLHPPSVLWRQACLRCFCCRLSCSCLGGTLSLNVSLRAFAFNICTTCVNTSLCSWEGFGLHGILHMLRMRSKHGFLFLRSCSYFFFKPVCSSVPLLPPCFFISVRLPTCRCAICASSCCFGCYQTVFSPEPCCLGAQPSASTFTRLSEFTVLIGR